MRYTFINFILLIVAGLLVALWFTVKPNSNEATLLAQTKINTVQAMIPEKETSIKPPELEKYKEIIAKRNIFAKVVKVAPPVVITVLQKYKLTGIAFDPANHNLSAAFISSADGRTQGMYCEGDHLDEWLIRKIEKKKVLLTDDNGKEAVLSLTSDVTSSTSANKSNTTPIKTPTIDIKDDFMGYKLPEIPQITPEKANEVSKQIKEVIEKLPPEIVWNKIQEYTGISKTEVSTSIDLGDYSAKLVLAEMGADIPGDGGEKIMFGTGVKVDNTPITPATLFNAKTDKRIYACFPNVGLIQGLSKVVTRWKNTTDGSVAYLGPQPINPTSSNNYIYVEKQKGWDKGIYQVELFRVDNMDKVAQGRFEMKD